MDRLEGECSNMYSSFVVNLLKRRLIVPLDSVFSIFGHILKGQVFQGWWKLYKDVHVLCSLGMFVPCNMQPYKWCPNFVAMWSLVTAILQL